MADTDNNNSVLARVMDYLSSAQNSSNAPDSPMQAALSQQADALAAAKMRQPFMAGIQHMNSPDVKLAQAHALHTLAGLGIGGGIGGLMGMLGGIPGMLVGAGVGAHIGRKYATGEIK